MKTERKAAIQQREEIQFSDRRKHLKGASGPSQGPSGSESMLKERAVGEIQWKLGEIARLGSDLVSSPKALNQAPFKVASVAERAPSSTLPRGPPLAAAIAPPRQDAQVERSPLPSWPARMPWSCVAAPDWPTPTTATSK